MTKNQRSGLASRCPNFLMEFHKVQCKKLLWTPTLIRYPPKHGPLYLVGFMFVHRSKTRKQKSLHTNRLNEKRLIH